VRQVDDQDMWMAFGPGVLASAPMPELLAITTAARRAVAARGNPTLLLKQLDDSA